MRILIAGQFKKWALENHYAKYLRQHAEVFIYPAEDMFDDYYHASIWNKIKFRLGVIGLYEKIAAGLMEKVKETQPDVVWIFKGMRIMPKTIEVLKAGGIKVVNYNPDHPFQFSSRGSGNKNVSHSIGLYDLHLSYSHNVQQRIEKEYNIPTAFLPFGFELAADVFETVKTDTEINRACFIGNPDPIRTAHILALANGGVPVDVYGHGWSEALSNVPNVQVHDAVYGIEFWQKMRAYRVQINIFRPHNEGSHNMRTFEIPAVGSIMLAPDSAEHREFFKIDEEIFTYRTKEEMVGLARYILELPAAKALKIRMNARSRSVNSGYAYEQRAVQALEAIKKVAGKKANGKVTRNDEMTPVSL